MADFQINVMVETRRARSGVREVNRELRRTETTAQAVSRSLRDAFAFVGLGLGINQVITLADAYTTLENRVRVANQGLGDTEATLDTLFGVANRSRVPIEQLTTLFQRASIAAGELNASQQDLFDFTEATAQALAIQGGATAESAGALVQLSQALGNARIQAQEFNSLVDGAFPLLQAAAQGIDGAAGSVARLRQEVLQGNVSNVEFFRAILENADQLEAQFARTVPTIRQALTVLRNQFIDLIGEVDSIPLVGQGILFLADNLDLITRSAIAAGVALGVNLVTGIDLADSRLGRFTASLLRNPLTAIPTIIALVVGGLIAFGDQLNASADDYETFQDVGTVAFDRLAERARLTADAAAFAFNDIANSITVTFPQTLGIIDATLDQLPESVRQNARRIDASFFGVLRTVGVVVDGMIGIFRAGFTAIFALIDRLDDALDQLGVRIANSIIGAIESAVNSIDFEIFGHRIDLPDLQLPRFTEGESPADIVRTLGRDISVAAQEALQTSGSPVGDAIERFINDVNVAATNRIASQLESEFEAEEQAALLAAARADQFNALLGGAGGASSESVNILREFNQGLEQSITLSQLYGNEREALQQLFQLENRLAREEVTLTDERRTALLGLITDTLEFVQLQERQRDILNEIQQPYENYRNGLAALNALLERGAITQTTFNERFRELQLDLLSTEQITTFGDAFVNQLQRMQLSAQTLNRDVGVQLAQIFGPDGDLVGGIAEASGRAIAFGDDFSASLRQVGQTILSEVLTALVRMAAQLLINKLLASSLFGSLFGGGGGDIFGGGTGPNSVSSIRLASGGHVTGPGTGTSDSIPAMLSNGEYVINARQTRRHRGLIEAINNDTLPRFQRGGLVGGAGGSDGAIGAPVLNNVVVNVNRDADVEVRQTEGGVEVDVAVRQMESQLAGRMARGQGELNRFLNSNFTRRTNR